MSDVENEDCSPEDELLKRHRQEKKDLKAKVMSLKKSVSKGDKKKKKEVTEEIAKLEAELDQRHELELSEFKSNETKEVSELSQNFESATIADDECEASDQGRLRVSKAQKRRDKKEQKEKDRQLDIERQDEENKLGLRHLEALKLKELLNKRQLAIHDITSDGDCLYNSIAHQLRAITGHTITVSDLRRSVAEVLRRQINDFLPFLSNPKTGEPLSEADFENYCQDLVQKPVWGGQVELRALTQHIRHPIEIIQAEGPPVLIGEEFKSKKLILTYHRHYYGLGEHYNSTKAAEPED